MKQNHLKIRTALYFVGLFVMTIGIALSVKSNLGVSPVSSIPYTMTCVWGIEMGKATILFHIVLVLLQILLLRRKFKPAQLLQVLVGTLVGVLNRAFGKRRDVIMGREETTAPTAAHGLSRVHLRGHGRQGRSGGWAGPGVGKGGPGQDRQSGPRAGRPLQALHQDRVGQRQAL